MKVMLHGLTRMAAFLGKHSECVKKGKPEIVCQQLEGYNA